MAFVGSARHKGASQHATLSTRAVRSDQFPQRNRCLRRSKASTHECGQFGHASNRFFPSSRVASCNQNWSPKRVKETGEFRGRGQRECQRPRSRKAWPSLESGGVKENDGGGWQLFFRFSRKWESEVVLPVVCVQRAQPSTLTQGTNMSCGAPRVPEQGSIEPVSGELCESCRQTTLTDGVVQRFTRRGFGEPHFSAKFLWWQARPHAAVLRSRGF